VLNVDDLTENERDAYEERAAILEEGNIGMSRYEAERRAMKAVMDRRKLI
jgi:hypothetical protein